MLFSITHVSVIVCLSVSAHDELVTCPGFTRPSPNVIWNRLQQGLSGKRWMDGFKYM